MLFRSCYDRCTANIINEQSCDNGYLVTCDQQYTNNDLYVYSGGGRVRYNNYITDNDHDTSYAYVCIGRAVLFGSYDCSASDCFNEQSCDNGYVVTCDQQYTNNDVYVYSGSGSVCYDTDA